MFNKRKIKEMFNKRRIKGRIREMIKGRIRRED